MWGKIKENNQWYSITTFIKYLDGSTEDIKEGIYEIKWKDKTVDKFSVIMEKEVTAYEDHGHSYDAVSYIPYIWISHRRNMIKCPLSKLDIEIRRVM